MSKTWWQSKTIWANVIAFVATIAGMFGFDWGLTPEVQAQIVAAVMAVVNVVLRFITDKPISGQ